MNSTMGFCSDCGEEYELDALDLDLNCADCVEQRKLDSLCDECGNPHEQDLRQEN